MVDKLVEGVLVQGEVTFTVNVDALVTLDTYEYEDRLNEFLVEKAIQSMNCSETEVEIMNEVDVTLTEKTYDQFVGCTVSNEDWTKIIQEKRLFED